MTTLLLIRHAMNDTVGRVLTGTAPGIPLNAAGREQAARLAERLRDVELTAVVSSPLQRARETAAPIALSHHLDLQIDPAFGEFELGEWTGRSFVDLDAIDAWRRFNAVRSLARPPGGELMLEVQQRTVAALLRLAAGAPAAPVAIVSHGDVIRSALMYFLGMPLDLVHRLEISPARISVVELDEGPPRVRQVNGDSVIGDG